MNTRITQITRVLTATAATVAGLSLHAAEPYHFLKEIPIGGDGGWDYLAVDSAAQRLYVSHATCVVVVDLTNDKIIGQIADTPGVHGIAIAPKLNRVYVSNGKGNDVSVVDAKTLQTLSKIKTGTNPDCISYDSKNEQVYAFNGRSSSVTVISAKTDKVMTTITLDGKPEFAQMDEGLNRIFDNLEDKSEVAVIDAKTHVVANLWPIAPGESASGLAMDAKKHRLFLGCDNKLMLMMDGETGKVLSSVPIGEGVDANAFDPGTGYAFASCGDGTTTIAKEDGDKLVPVQTLKTVHGSRTMALDLSTHNIYLPSAQFAAATNQPSGGHKRPSVVPGSFKILVYSMDKP